MKTMSTLILLLVAIIGNTQTCCWGEQQGTDQTITWYFGGGAGTLKSSMSAGLTGGVSVDRATISATFTANQYGREGTITGGWVLNLSKSITVVPKAGIVMGTVVGSKESSEAYGPGTFDKYQYATAGGMVSWHRNMGSIYFEVIGNTMMLGMRVMSFTNEKQ